MNLYELTEQYETLLEMAEGEADPNMNFEVMIVGMEGAIGTKIDACCKVVKSLEAQEGAIAQEMARLATRKASISNNTKKLKEGMKAAMVRLNVDKHKSPFFTVSVTKPRERVEIINPDSVPFQYKSLPEPVIDKKSVMEAIKRGLTIPGATVVEGEKGLTIR